MMFDNNNVHKIVNKAIKDSKLKGSVNKSNGGKVTTYTKNNSMFTIKVESFRSFFAGETISFWVNTGQDYQQFGVIISTGNHILQNVPLFEQLCVELGVNVNSKIFMSSVR